MILPVLQHSVGLGTDIQVCAKSKIFREKNWAFIDPHSLVRLSSKQFALDQSCDKIMKLADKAISLALKVA